ncbi:hypothetical protein [Sediminicola sp. YIK13]|uniref:hypothetical protein n=1 Tax=Sediminicola sp. YIK13 TaxID=1453352 RepID=UPI0011A21CBE|nr:hypothetical protein [Sediminicola sp. YIK13]
MAVPADSLFIYGNFLSGIENGLLLSRTLNKIDKKSYKELFSKIKTEDAKKTIVQDLKIGSEQEKRTIDTIYLDLGCFSALVQLEKLVDENDFRYKMNKIGEKLLMDTYNYELIDQLIDVIPDKEFQKIEYRRMLLRLIYNHLTTEKIQ